MGGGVRLPLSDHVYVSGTTCFVFPQPCWSPPPAQCALLSIFVVLHVRCRFQRRCVASRVMLLLLHRRFAAPHCSSNAIMLLCIVATSMLRTYSCAQCVRRPVDADMRARHIHIPELMILTYDSWLSSIVSIATTMSRSTRVVRCCYTMCRSSIGLTCIYVLIVRL